MINNSHQRDIYMSLEQMERFFDKIFNDDDLDFYEEHIIYLSDEEQERFFRNNPDFMSGYPEEYDRMDLLLRKRIYREILRKIKEYE